MIKFNNKQAYMKIENIFVAFSLIFGILFAFINPPFQAPDETVHFYRAYQISTGQLFELKNDKLIGGYLPKSLVKTANEVSKGIATHPKNKQKIDKIKFYMKLHLNKSDVIFTDFRGAAIYTPVVYIPQSIGINIAKLFKASALEMMYFGRIMNLIFWIAMVYYSIKLLPFKKNMLFLLALTPMTIYQASSLSGDAMTNALAFLSISLVLNYAFGKSCEITKKQIAIMIFIFVLLSFSKQVYFVFSFLFLLIPRSKFKNSKSYIITFALLIMACMASIGVLYIILNRLSLQISGNANSSLQIKYVLSHPFQYIIVLFRTLHFMGKSYVNNFVGVFGWLDTILPSWLYKLYYIIFIIILFSERTAVIQIKHIIVIISVFLVGFGLVMSALYASWSPVGGDIVQGVQGRYFIPIVPILATTIGRKKTFFKDAHIKMFLTAFMFIVLMCSVSELLLRYYGLRLL